MCQALVIEQRTKLPRETYIPGKETDHKQDKQVNCKY